MKQCIWSVLYIHGVCMAYMQRTLMTSGMWSDGWTALHGAAQNAGSVGVGSWAARRVYKSTGLRGLQGCGVANSTAELAHSGMGVVRRGMRAVSSMATCDEWSR